MKSSDKSASGLVGKIAILSTYFENVGDDLIRSGVEGVVRKVLPNASLKHLSKSNRLSLAASLGRATHSPRWQMKAVGKRLHDALVRRVPRRVFEYCKQRRLFDADALVVAGTPLFYFTKRKFTFLKNGFWAQEIIKPSLDRGLPVFIMGAGVIVDQDMDRIAAQWPEECEFLRDLADRGAIFGVRDETSCAFMKAIGIERVIQTHCPSLWNDRPVVERCNDSCLVSFSTESARIDENGEDSVRKRCVMLETLIARLKKDGMKVTFTAHNQDDLQVQSRWAERLGLPRPLLITQENMLRTFGSCAALVTWRVHGAMAARLMDTPVLLFKTDNRYRMAEEVGARIVDDREMAPNIVLREYEALLTSTPTASVPTCEIEIEKARFGEELLRRLKPVVTA